MYSTYVIIHIYMVWWMRLKQHVSIRGKKNNTNSRITQTEIDSKFEEMEPVSVLVQLLQNLPLTYFLLTWLLVLALAYYVYANRHHGTWERLGVPGPKPWPIVDHKPDLKQGPDVAIKKWYQEYGKTFGVYGLVPQRPVLVTKDVALARQVLVKDFDSFMERSRNRRTYSSLKTAMTSITGDHWRRIRLVTSPMFTGSRMRSMLRHISDSAQSLTQLAKEKAAKGELIPLKQFSAKFSTEVIARIGFGLNAHAASETETEFAYQARNMIGSDSKVADYVMRVAPYFPPVEDIARFVGVRVDFVKEKADDYFVGLLESQIKSRTQQGVLQNEDKARDLLDMLLNVRTTDEDPRLKDNESRALSHSEVVGNSTMLILAGVDTVSTTFQSILYCLAQHPDIQDKVIDEIDAVFPRGSKVDYEKLGDLNYTEQVINECLRLFPLISNILRVAAATKTYGDITIPKGAYVMISLGEIMKDPEYWPEPEKFDPDRFSPENRANREQFAFLPFSTGPRICLGMRLAMMELKVILVYLLRDLKFILSDKTQPKKGEKLAMQASTLIMRPRDPIQLEVVPRSG